MSWVGEERDRKGLYAKVKAEPLYHSLPTKKQENFDSRLLAVIYQYWPQNDPTTLLNSSGYSTKEE